MADAKPKKSAPAKKIVDVKSDGDGATGTSRPVIVTNRPILKDPMMAEVSNLTGGLEGEPKQSTPVEQASGTADAEVKSTEGAPELVQVTTKKDAETTTEKTEDKPAVAPSQKKIVITPPGTDQEPEKVPTTVSKDKEPTIADLAKPDPLPGKDIAAKDVKQHKADPETSSDADDKADKDPDDDVSTEAAGDELVGAVQPGRSFDETTDLADSAKTKGGAEQIELDEKGKPKKQIKKSGELTAEQQKAIENGEYFLPITTAETRRMRREILFSTLFVLVLIVVWLDIMLDAGLLSLGNIKAVTDFF